MDQAFTLHRQPHEDEAQIRTHRFDASPEVREKPAEELANFVPLRRLGLIQICAVDEGVRAVMRLDHVPLTRVFDLILDEAMPLIREATKPAIIRLDTQETAGLVITYRGMDFLFADRDPLVTRDFVVFRPASADACSGWPDVESPAGP